MDARQQARHGPAARPFRGGLGKLTRRRLSFPLWIAAHIEDTESDLSAIHRIDDPGPLPAARMWALAQRLLHYQGVVRAKVLAEQRDSKPDVPPGTEWVPDSQMLALLQ